MAIAYLVTLKGYFETFGFNVILIYLEHPVIPWQKQPSFIRLGCFSHWLIDVIAVSNQYKKPWYFLVVFLMLNVFLAFQFYSSSNL